MYVCKFPHTYAHTNIHAYIHTYTYMYIRRHSHTQTCTYTHMLACTYVNTDQHTHTHTPTHKNTHKHTHKHIHTPLLDIFAPALLRIGFIPIYNSHGQVGDFHILYCLCVRVNCRRQRGCYVEEARSIPCSQQFS